jgi:hypothetical protein
MRTSTPGGCGWHVVREALDEHMREEADAEQPSVDHPEGTRGDLHPDIAVPARVLLARDLMHDRYLQAFELLRDVFPDHGQLVSA